MSAGFDVDNCTMTDPATPTRPAPRWLHAWAVGTAAATLGLLVLGQLVTTFRAGMADPVWPTEPWYLVDNYKVDFGYLIEHAHRIAGFLIGGLVAVLALGVLATSPRPATRWVGLTGVVLLLAGFGEFHRAMMAQRDALHLTLPVGPVLFAGAALAVVLFAVMADAANGVRGAGLRAFGVVVLLAVMTQGLLGGFRVRHHALYGTDLAAVHGVFAQVVFSLLVSVAVLTAVRPAGFTAALRSVRVHTLGLVALVFVQLVWGAMVRHAPTPLAQRLHFLTAFLVVAAVIHLLQSGARLGAGGWLLGGLIVVQVTLGVEAWMGKFGKYTLPELAPAVTPGAAAVRTLHTLVGTGVLATAVALAVRAWAFRPAVETADDGVGRAWDDAGGRELAAVGAGPLGGTR